MSDKGSQEDISEVYRERNIAVALAVALARRLGYAVGYRPSDEPDGDGWYVVFVELPTGQVSWHMPLGDILYIPQDILQIAPIWDGHTTGEKHACIARYTNPADME